MLSKVYNSKKYYTIYGYICKSYMKIYISSSFFHLTVQGQLAKRAQFISSHAIIIYKGSILPMNLINKIVINLYH